MFSSMKKFFGKKAQEEKGASAVEYALLAGLIAVAIYILVGELGQKMAAVFTTIRDAFN